MLQSWMSSFRMVQVSLALALRESSVPFVIYQATVEPMTWPRPLLTHRGREPATPTEVLTALRPVLWRSCRKLAEGSGGRLPDPTIAA